MARELGNGTDTITDGCHFTSLEFLFSFFLKCEYEMYGSQPEDPIRIP